MVAIVTLILLFITLDQISKYYILNNMILGESNTIINNFFSITSHRNRGAAWGILEDSRVFFIVVTFIILSALVIYFYKQRNKLNLLDKLAASLLIGGAVGNLIDRIKTGEVVDFLDFNLFSYPFPIFNLADTFICIGVFLLMIKIYREPSDNW